MSAEKICPTCGTEYPANERFCPRDGTALRSQGASTDLVGSIIAERYHVLKKLGEGGMGQVYLAEHVKMGRKSAVKVMNPGMVNDADAISRFNREAANASRINHPNVAGIYDFGETSDGLIYLAMEFVEGESLTSLVEKNGALAPIRAANIAKQAADGLAVAHDMGIVHRDLKPDNIMIAKNRDGSDCVKVVDFGIAKAAGAENQNVTKTGLVVGTPDYMSPEQLAGDKLAGTSDIYSLALVAFNMFTGTLPFQGESAQESMIMRLTDDPKTLAATKPDVTWTPDVQAVMAKALRRRSAERYQSAADFGRELYMAVEKMPVSKQMEAGTVVMGAAPPTVAKGGTAVMEPPPPTRVDRGSEPAPKLIPAPPSPPAAKSKAPMFVGGGVAVAAALLASVYFTQTANKSGATPAPKDSVVTTVEAPVVQPPAPTSQPTSQPTQGAVLSSNPGTSTKLPARGDHMPAATPPLVVQADVASRMKDLLAWSADLTKTTQAINEAQALLPQAKGDEVVGLRYVEARAYGMRSQAGDSVKACSILRGVKDRAKGTRYDERVTVLLEASC